MKNKIPQKSLSLRWPTAAAVPASLEVNQWTSGNNIILDPATPLLYNFLVARRPTHFYGTAGNLQRAKRVLEIMALGAGYTTPSTDEIAFFRLQKPSLRQRWQSHLYSSRPAPVSGGMAKPALPVIQPLFQGITFMGCNTLFDWGDHATYASFLYWSGGRALWVDPLPGGPWPVEKYVTAYYLSHLHPDHVFGVLERLALAQQTGRTLVLYAHAQLWAPLAELFSLYYPELKPLRRQSPNLTWIPMEKNVTFEQATLTPFTALHSLPTYGFVAQDQGFTFGFTGDHCHQEETFRDLRLYLTRRRGWRAAAADERLDYLRYYLSACDFLVHDAGEASPAHHPRLYRPVHTDPADIPVRPGQTVWLTHYSPHVLTTSPRPFWHLAQSGESCLFNHRKTL